MQRSRCKILAGLSLAVIIGKIILSSVWTTKTIVSPTEHSETQKLSAEKSGFIVSYGASETKLVIDPGAINLSSKTKLITKLPGGGIALSRELQEELDRRLKAATDKKIILVWVPSWGVKREIHIDEEQCGNCEVTYDRSKINNENVGAVLFYFDGIRAKDMPPTRNCDHLYIFCTMESTAYLRITRGQSLKFEDSFKFNATLTYRRDSEFYSSDEWAGTVESIVQNNNLSLKELLKKKTKLALATVSNCGATHGAKIRLQMLKELVDLNFGLEACGRCFSGKFGPHREQPQFHQEVRKYKFYFSFENARHCKDYITEKLFNNALLSLSVPVVWGPKKEDYEAVAPPGSFIFADDFPSMKALSEYLKYLDGNDTAYLEYFKWLTMKPSEMPQYGRARTLCQVCRALHGINVDDVYSPKFDENNLKRPLFTSGIAKRTLDSLIDWFYGEDNPECFD